MAAPEKIKILFIVQHRFNRSPGQRYRCEQYIPYLESHGFECVYSPLIATKAEDDALYNSHSLLQALARCYPGPTLRHYIYLQRGFYDGLSLF